MNWNLETMKFVNEKQMIQY